jgi:hypothetical protein
MYNLSHHTCYKMRMVPVEPVILLTEILHYFGTKWSDFHHGMKKGLGANASSDSARYQNDFLTEATNVVDQLEGLEFVYVYGDQFEDYRKLAIAKFNADEEDKDKARDELHDRAKVDDDLHVYCSPLRPIRQRVILPLQLLLLQLGMWK